MGPINAVVALSCLCLIAADAPVESGRLNTKFLPHEVQQKWGSRRRTSSFGSRRRGSYHSGYDDDSGGGSSLGAFFMGVCLWCLIPTCLCQNERIAIKQAKMQGKAARESVVVDDPGRSPIDELEGHMLFVSGESKCDETLKDSEFENVTAKNCVKLRRIVEMRQWVEIEEKDEDKDSTSVRWEMRWCETQQRCPRDNNGQHTNPDMPFPSTSRTATDDKNKCAEASPAGIKFGAYYCGDFVRREMCNWADKTIKEGDLSHAKLTGWFASYEVPKQSDGWWYYQKKGESKEALGTIRVKFEELQCGPLSVCGILAKTSMGWTFVPLVRLDGGMNETFCDEFGLSSCPCAASSKMHFQSSGDDKDLKDYLSNVAHRELNTTEMNKFHLLTGDEEKTQTFYKSENESGASGLLHIFGFEEEFLGVKETQETPEQMLKEEADSAFVRHCGCRVLGLLCGMGGACCIISPFVSFLTSSWFIYLLGGGLIACALQCAACLCSITAVTLIISCAWIRHRPRLGIFVLLLLGAVYAGLHAVATSREGATCGSFSGTCQVGSSPLSEFTVCRTLPCSESECCGSGDYPGAVPGVTVAPAAAVAAPGATAAPLAPTAAPYPGTH